MLIWNVREKISLCRFFIRVRVFFLLGPFLTHRPFDYHNCVYKHIVSVSVPVSCLLCLIYVF